MLVRPERGEEENYKQDSLGKYLDIYLYKTVSPDQLLACWPLAGQTKTIAGVPQPQPVESFVSLQLGMQLHLLFH